MLDAIHEGIVIVQEGARVICEKDDGSCVLRGEDGCELHARLGPSLKPEACVKFPYRLVATPTGGRIVTEHRCPCRSMGERAPLCVEVAVESGVLDQPDRVLTGALPLDDGELVDMPAWEVKERGILDSIVRGEGLGEAPFASGKWEALACELAAVEGPSRFVSALHCFASAVLGEPLPELPWDEAFDRAEARSSEGAPEVMLADWLADEVWSLEWAFVATWRQARLDLATRAAIARRIATGLPRRPDRAMAEAIAVVELVAIADEHRALLRRL